MYTQLVELAKHDGRHTDAIALLDEVLRRTPNDGDALLSRARVIGWDDRWAESHEHMVNASQAAPTHGKLGKTLGATLGYAGWHKDYPVTNAIRVRFHIIRNAYIENVGKSQSCMVSKLRIIWKQTVHYHFTTP